MLHILHKTEREDHFKVWKKLEFMARLMTYIYKHTSKIEPEIRAQKMTSHEWMRFDIGKYGTALFVSIEYNKVGVGFEVFNENGKEFFRKHLFDERNVIRNELKIKANWKRLNGAPWIVKYIENVDFSNKDEWEKYFESIFKNLKEFHDAFKPRVQNYK